MIYLLRIDHPHGHLTASSFRLLLNALIGGGNVLDSLHWIRQANLEVILSLFLDCSYINKIAVSFLQRVPFNTSSLLLMRRELCLWWTAKQDLVSEIFSTWRLDLYVRNWFSRQGMEYRMVQESQKSSRCVANQQVRNKCCLERPWVSVPFWRVKQYMQGRKMSEQSPISASKLETSSDKIFKEAWKVLSWA